MRREHRGHDGSGLARLTVATIADAPPYTVLHAFFADLTIAEQQAPGAEQPVILHNLDYRHLRVTARPVDRGRNHHKRILDMHDIGHLSHQQFAEFPPRVPGPDRSLGESQLS